MRYNVRKEYYGAIVYDKDNDLYCMIDEEFYDALGGICECGTAAYDEDTISFLTEEGFIEDGKVNYRLIDTGNVVPGVQSAPSRVHFYYTSSCNLNCAHCFTKQNAHKVELTYDQKIDMLDQMVDLGIGEILIGGGEPFTKSDFPDFVEACIARDISTKVFTNGLLLDNDELISRMSSWKLRYMAISFDGANDDDYAYVRGVSGLETIRTVAKKIKSSCSFELVAQVTVNHQNFDKAAQIVDRAFEFGFDRLKVRPIKPGGNVLLNPELFISAEQYSQFLVEAQRRYLEKYCESSFRVDFGWGDNRLFYNKESQAIEVLDVVYPYEDYGCLAAKLNIIFDSAGYAITCGFLPKELRSTDEDCLTKKTIKDIWSNGVMFKKLRNQPGNPTCRNCEYYEICRGGCIARNLFVGKDVNDVDPWCIKKYFPLKVN